MSSRRDDGGKKGSKGSKSDWHGDKDEGGTGSKGKGKGKSETHTATTGESKGISVRTVHTSGPTA